MADLNEYEADINEQLTSIEKEIEGLKKKEPSQRARLIDKCEAKARNTQMSIDSYQLEILYLGKVAAATAHNNTLRLIKERMKGVKSTVSAIKNEYAVKNTFLEGKGAEERESNVELAELGKKIQEKSQQSLEKTLRMINESEIIAGDISSNLAEQEAKLKGITDDVKENQVVIKRAKAYLQYFAKQIYTDKFLMSLIFLIVLAIVGIIGYKLFGNSSDSQTGDNVLLQSSTSAATTTKRLLSSLRAAHKL